MQKLSYIRICAFASIAIIVALYSYTIYFNLHAINNNNSKIILTALAIYVIPLTHSIQLLSIYKKYYPDKEVGRPFKTINLITGILCLINLAPYIFYIYAYTSKTYTIVNDNKSFLTPIILLFVVLSITLLVQFVGSFHLIKTIQRNARQQLENHFV